MDTLPLFFEDHFQAIRAAIEGGRGYKETALRLWPSMKPDSAYARLKKSCHPDTDYKLDLAEVIAICAINDRFEPVYFMCAETRHERPKQVLPEQAAKDLVQHVQAVSDEFTRSVAKLEALTRANPSILKSVA